MPEQNSVNDALAHIERLLQARQLDAAEASLRELLQRDPGVSAAWFYMGLALLLRENRTDAEAAFRQAVAIDPQQTNAWTNLSIVVRSQGRAAEAEDYARRALSVNASHADLWVNLSACLIDQRKLAEAAQACRRALALNPQAATAWGNLAVIEQTLGRLNAAEQAYERSLALAPGDPGTLTNYANFLNQRRQPQRVAALLLELLSRHPNLPAAWVELGSARHLVGDFAQAEAAFRRALAVAPQHRDARRNLSLSLLKQWSLAEAEFCARQLLTEDPNDAGAWILLGTILWAGGTTDEALSALRRSLELAPTPMNHSKLLHSLQYADTASPDQLLQAHREWNAAFATRLFPSSPPAVAMRATTQPLRLGFVSGDFGRHPIGYLALRALESLNRSDCNVVCFSDRLVEDDFTARFRATADLWRLTAGLTEDELAEQIRSDKIDVLFDLGGHLGHRLLVFARKPAPLQITWLGYVGTTGLDAMDFLLADRFHVRQDEEAWYRECVLRMPNGYACYGAGDDAPEVGPLPALAAGRVTFGCFNNSHKYAPRTLDAWAAILSRVPSAQLLLKYDGLDRPTVQAWILGVLGQRGVERERIILEGHSSQPELLACYHRVDLAIDTQPYSGGLTTCEALWMGVPVITYPGKTFASRHSVSHLTNAGYEQFVANDVEGYVELAVQWSNRLDELATIRLQMRDRVRQSPLCDAPRFADDLLYLLRQAWESRAVSKRQS